MDNFKKFTKNLKEHAVYDLDLSQFDDYFADIKDDIKTLKNFSNEMDILKEMFKEITIDEIIIKKIDAEDYKIDFAYKYKAQITSIIGFYNEILIKNSILIEKIDNDYYNGGTLRLDFEIDIEINNFNKMHFPINLPTSLKNIGLGRKIFLATINKIGYTLFSSIDISLDAKITIQSIVKKEKSIYSFIKDKNIMSFASSMNLNDIKKELIIWLNIIDYDNLILDKDFYEKYKKQIKLDDILSKLYDEFFNKYY